MVGGSSDGVQPTRSIRWLRAWWRAGRSSWIVHRGWSMAPALCDGDRLRVDPLRGAPRPGDVVVLQRHGKLIAHRLLRVDGGVATTRGDALPYEDQPSGVGDIVGTVGRVRRPWLAWLWRRIAPLAFGRS